MDVVDGAGSDDSRKVSEHYTGERGQAFFSLKQQDSHSAAYEIEAAYFRPYVVGASRVLDFGCGNGGLGRVLSRDCGSVDGLEVNPSAGKLAEKNTAHLYRSLDDLPRKPIYDVVISNHALEHVRDVCEALERLRECLIPGGRMVIKLPIDDHRDPRQQQWDRHDVDHHLQTWTPRLFGNVLYETGMEVEDIRIITSAFHPRLFPLYRIGLGHLAFWLLAFIRRRRQLFVVARRPLDKEV